MKIEGYVIVKRTIVFRKVLSKIFCTAIQPPLLPQHLKYMLKKITPSDINDHHEISISVCFSVYFFYSISGLFKFPEKRICF